MLAGMVFHFANLLTVIGQGCCLQKANRLKFFSGLVEGLLQLLQL